MCRLVGLAESSYYYEQHGRTDKQQDGVLLQALVKLAARNPRRGYRYLWRQVRKQKGFAGINRKRVQRVLKMAEITAKRGSGRVFTTDSNHAWRRYPNLMRDWSIVDRPDQVWCADITYVVLASGEVVYLAIVMDLYTRIVRGWSLGRDLAHTLPLEALNRALKAGVCDIHHSDQGVQYATPHYTEILHQRGIQISMTDRGAAWQNGCLERLNRTVKDEEVYISDYADFDEALKHIGKFIDQVYNAKREHSSLGNLSPKDFEAKWWASRVPKSVS